MFSHTADHLMVAQLEMYPIRIEGNRKLWFSPRMPKKEIVMLQSRKKLRVPQFRAKYS